MNNQNSKNKKKINLRLFSWLFLFFLGFFAVNYAEAAILYFNPSSGNYTVGNIFTVNILVNTEGVAINNAEAVINFPSDFLEIVSVSKSGSTFSLWVEEPTFSNSAGTLSFNGGLPTPGYNSSAGKILSTVFRVKKVGSASLLFSSAAVRANDGYGTNVFKTGVQALFNLISEEKPLPPEEELPPPIVSGVPEAPQVSSLTHPDPEKWYSNNDPEFNWTLPQDVNGVSIYLSKSPTSNPGPLPDGLFSSKSYQDIEDGISYFHIKFKNQYGWGEITHRKVLIDTEPPKPFEIEVKEGKETTHPQPTLVFETSDDTSGVSYYEIIIDKENPIKTEGPEYKLPSLILGKYTIIVKAVDEAENQMLAMTEINILPIETPIITDYPHELLPGSILSIKGTALPEVTVKLYIQKDEKEIKTGETKSDKEGKWVYIEVEPVEKGVYQVWAEAIDISGARSELSEKVTVLVSPPVFIRIGKLAIDYLTTIITLLILILIIVLIILWGWLEIKKKRKKIQKEITEAEKALYQAFKALKEETEEQIAKLDGKPGLSKRETKICNDLKKALKISEEFVGKEIKDVLKELE